MMCSWCLDHEKYLEKAKARNAITGVKDKEVRRFVSLAANAQRMAGHKLGECNGRK
jgi:hypothetical protein